MKTKFILLTALIVIFTAFANAQSSLIGEWKIVSITNSKSGNVSLGKTDIFINFDKKRVNGNACNNFGGDYSVAKNTLKFAKVITTAKACKEVEIENLVQSVFRKTAYFTVKKDVLTLVNSDRIITLHLEKVKKNVASLIGNWQLNSLILDGKEFSWDEKDVFLNIEKDKIGGNGGCNSYGGNVAMKGNTVRFSNIISTKMFCEGSIENQYFEALGKVTNFSFEFKNSQLILTDKTKQTVLKLDKVIK